MSSINLTQDLTGKAYFINGVNCPESEATDNQKLLQENSGFKVKLIWNPLGLVGVVHDETEAKMAELVNRIQTKVQKRLDQSRDVCLIPHSKGCHAVQIALQNLEKTHGELMRKHIQIYAYGGVVKLQNSLGVKVENYFSQGLNSSIEDKGDIIAWLGHILLWIFHKIFGSACSFIDTSLSSSECIVKKIPCVHTSWLELHKFDTAYLENASLMLGKFKEHLEMQLEEKKPVIKIESSSFPYKKLLLVSHIAAASLVWAYSSGLVS